MRHSKCFAGSVFIVLACAGLGGCAQDDLVDAGLNVGQQTEVESAAQAVTMGGPAALASESMIVDLMGLIVPARAPGDPTCPPTFDLGNGITGSCSATGTDATFAFGGTLMVDGELVALSGSLSISVAAGQPAVGTTYSIAFDASASGPRGDANWSTSGDVTVDDARNVIDISLVITVTATSAGGFSSTVTAVVDANSFELIVNGPLGGVLRFELDRATMTGRVLLNGLHVADVTIANGCATIRYTLPGMQDRVVCSDD